MPDLNAQVREIKDHIRARIIRAELVEGHRIDAGDIRQATGGSVRAVRMALNELASEGLLSRRQRVGTFVAGGVARAGIAPLPVVRSVAVLSSATSDALNRMQFAIDVLEGMSFALATPSRLEYCTHAESGKAIDVLPTVDTEVLRSLVQGVVALEAYHSGRLNDISRAGLPLVAIDFNPQDAAFDSVYVDHEDAGFQCTAHLVAMGHRRIALIGERCYPQSTDPTWQERLSGYLRAMAWAGGETPQPLLLGGPRDMGKLRRDLPAFHRRHQPTAYVLVTGGWVETVLEILGTSGVHCPRDVSITCADSSCPKLGDFALTYTRADYEEAGRLAIQLIASRIACRAMPAVRVRLPVVFNPGDSSRAAVPE